VFLLRISAAGSRLHALSVTRAERLVMSKIAKMEPSLETDTRLDGALSRRSFAGWRLGVCDGHHRTDV